MTVADLIKETKKEMIIKTGHGYNGNGSQSRITVKCDGKKIDICESNMDRHANTNVELVDYNSLKDFEKRLVKDACIACSTSTNKEDYKYAKGYADRAVFIYAF